LVLGKQAPIAPKDPAHPYSFRIVSGARDYVSCTPTTAADRPAGSSIAGAKVNAPLTTHAQNFDIAPLPHLPPKRYLAEIVPCSLPRALYLVKP